MGSTNRFDSGGGGGGGGGLSDSQITQITGSIFNVTSQLGSLIKALYL